jgi:3-isopropylmalate/(R)-2-methylmalate dehydratase large subunit
MGMTISEKILARASGLSKVKPGDIVVAKFDLALIRDIGGPHVINAFYQLGLNKIKFPEKMVVLHDITPASSVKTAANQKMVNDFAKKFQLNRVHYGEGIYHDVLVDKGYIAPGTLNIVTDSHAVTLGGYGTFSTGVGISDIAIAISTGELWFKVPETLRYEISGNFPAMTGSKDLMLKILEQGTAHKAIYRAVDFGGPAVEVMSIESRLVLANMAVELGGKTGIIEPNPETEYFLREKLGGPVEVVRNDRDVTYSEVIHMDVSELEPMIACPHSPDNVVPARKVIGKKIDQAFLGTCCNGRLEDLRVASQILKGCSVHPDVRLIVMPTTKEVVRKAIQEGIMDIFYDANAIVCNPNCGPCFGVHQGVLGPGDICLSTGNRNFQGRMGSPEAEIYLSSPATLAASAITGAIADPRDFL